MTPTRGNASGAQPGAGPARGGENKNKRTIVALTIVAAIAAIVIALCAAFLVTGVSSHSAAAAPPTATVPTQIVPTQQSDAGTSPGTSGGGGTAHSTSQAVTKFVGQADSLSSSLNTLGGQINSSVQPDGTIANASSLEAELGRICGTNACHIGVPGGLTAHQTSLANQISDNLNTRANALDQATQAGNIQAAQTYLHKDNTAAHEYAQLVAELKAAQ